jgi:DNA replication and repair protein RecF
MAPALLRFADRSPPIDRAPEGFARGGAAASVTGQPLVRRLRLRAFRNFAALDLRLAGDAAPVVLHGPNGAGKTNLLEALSLLAPGRGLRRARLDSLDCDADPVQPFRIDAEIATADGPVDLATGRDPAAERRWLEVMGESRRGLAPLAELVAIAWLTPAMDRLFLDAASERRRFLDRLVLAVYPEHARQTAIFERAMRERSLLLRQGPRDPAWLRVLEERMAARASPLPPAGWSWSPGSTPSWPSPTRPCRPCASTSRGRSRLARERCRNRCRGAAGERARGQRAAGCRDRRGRGRPASQRSCRHRPRHGRAAPRVSTGRQKAMLVAIILAEARLRQRVHGDLPILLLDETMAHLDPTRRDGLAERLLGARRPGLPDRHRTPPLRCHGRPRPLPTCRPGNDSRS